MKNAYKHWLAAALAIIICAPLTVNAHHSHASLDRDNVLVHSGVVTKYSFRVPHVFLQVEGPNARGETVNWTIELSHPAAMLSTGWTKDSFVTGDRVMWEGARDRDPNRYYSGLSWVQKTDGTRFEAGFAATKTEQQITPSSDFTGLWVRDSRVGFSYAPLENWPYTEFGQQLVDNFDEKTNPQLDCQDPGPPKSTSLPYPMQISRPDTNTVVLDYDMRDQQRVFRLDQDSVPAAPSKVGQSKAWMEGEELVVETTNFLAERWGSYTGVDSSNQKHLIERFSVIEGGYTLRIQMTLSDPVYLAEPVEIDYYMRKTPDRGLLPPNCNLESARLFFEAGYNNNSNEESP